MHWLMISNKGRFMAINQEFDLAPQQAIALRILGGGPRPMGELARYLMCDSSNVTGITDRLEERGLVRRTLSDQDRRVKLLVLTDEGRASARRSPSGWPSRRHGCPPCPRQTSASSRRSWSGRSRPIRNPANERERADQERGESWDGVETGPGRFGSVRFTVGRRELGHLHGDRIADLLCAPRSPGSWSHRATPATTATRRPTRAG